MPTTRIHLRNGKTFDLDGAFQDIETAFTSRDCPGRTIKTDNANRLIIASSEVAVIEEL